MVIWREMKAVIQADEKKQFNSLWCTCREETVSFILAVVKE